jgi:two-component system chemotaxis response regulator CheY
MKAPSILIVEDDPDSSAMMAAMLTLHGYVTNLAANGAEALAHARQSRPCLILLDLMMPVMDGPSFRAEQLADPALASVPVMVVSGRHNARTVADDLGAVGVVAKPVVMDALLDAVRKYCPAGTRSREPR